MAKNKTETTAAPVEAPANGSEQAQAETLGVADLQNCAQVIDVAVSRGAFRANEVAQVGAVYNKLEAFIKSVNDAQKVEAPASE
tara:strand:- start:35861 stop:36112 length:252 start_codon:yes stop_codon:yes gene_type:complete